MLQFPSGASYTRRRFLRNVALHPDLLHQVQRIGPQHQAGSDALLTSKTFFKMRQTFFEDKIADDRFAGQLYGLGGGAAGAVTNSNFAGANPLASTLAQLILDGNGATDRPNGLSTMQGSERK